MTSKKIYFATIISSNKAEFDFPYQGGQRAELKLRSHPRLGKEILFTIEKGQFSCGIENCSVLVRFDNDEPINISAGGASSGNPRVLFLDSYDLLVKKLSKSKALKISAEFYQEGNRIFEFNINGFSESRFLEKNDNNTKPEKSTQQLIDKAEKPNDKCRGGSGSDPSTMKACDDRELVIKDLKKTGWCWGEDNQIEADKKWQPCK
jgi:hypothetical protein